MLIKFFMGEPRPFWVTNEIDSFYCDIMYSSPDRCCFNIIFFMLYAIYQFQWKFNANQPSKFLLAILYSLVILYSILNAFIMAYFGLVYLHQSVISIMMSLIYLAICIIFDDEIMFTCEEMGFKKKASRKYKFYLLFASIGAFVLAAMICSGQTDTWVTNPDWLRNSIDDLLKPDCQ